MNQNDTSLRFKMYIEKDLDGNMISFLSYVSIIIAIIFFLFELQYSNYFIGAKFFLFIFFIINSIFYFINLFKNKNSILPIHKYLSYLVINFFLFEIFTIIHFYVRYFPYWIFSTFLTMNIIYFLFILSLKLNYNALLDSTKLIVIFVIIFIIYFIINFIFCFQLHYFHRARGFLIAIIILNSLFLIAVFINLFIFLMTKNNKNSVSNTIFLFTFIVSVFSLLFLFSNIYTIVSDKGIYIVMFFEFFNLIFIYLVNKHKFSKVKINKLDINTINNPEQIDVKNSEILLLNQNSQFGIEQVRNNRKKKTREMTKIEEEKDNYNKTYRSNKIENIHDIKENKSHNSIKSIEDNHKNELEKSKENIYNNEKILDIEYKDNSIKSEESIEKHVIKIEEEKEEDKNSDHDNKTYSKISDSDKKPDIINDNDKENSKEFEF